MVRTKDSSSRSLALARRKAMSSGGKAAVANNGDVTRAELAQPVRTKPVPAATTSSVESESAPAPRARAAAPARTRRKPAATVSPSNTSRDATLARRRAQSTSGKSAKQSSDRVRTADSIRTAKANAASKDATKDAGCGCGCGGKGKSAEDAAPTVDRGASKTRSSSRSSRSKRRKDIPMSTSKMQSLARRKAQSSRGKAGISNTGMSQAQTARAANPNLSSRELSQTVRAQRSKSGSAGQKASRPTGRVRKAASEAGAQDATWKVGASETTNGQILTGTMVGRDRAVTGDEASTCRDVTGTDYMGADIFRDFCEAEPVTKPTRGGVSATQSGNSVTGNEVGRSEKVTGDEPGTCSSVTGTEYVGAGQSESFCGTKPATTPAMQVMGMTNKEKVITGDNVVSSKKVTGGEAGAGRQLTGAQYVQPVNREAPAKVGRSSTLSGGEVTGTEVGRSTKTTGDEAGSCRAVTGDDYLSQEQFQNFCKSTPAPQDKKVGVSATDGGQSVTGTLNGRSERVTGNEPGTCKAVTGTPYAGVEQASGYCEAPAAQSMAARTSVMPRKAGANMTGIQPGVGGVMTGDEKGACEAVSGTPYIGDDQQAAACAAEAAGVSSSDFPQSIDSAEWGDFSVEAPSHASVGAEQESGITGAMSSNNNITGPFGMAGGKVTGTEEARFGNVKMGKPAVAEEPETISGRIKARISGEGVDAGSKITGDDWDRGDRVTGTEGMSAKTRNETRGAAGSMAAMAAMKANRDAERTAPEPISRVTGASGSTSNGSLITFSGGARG